MKLSKEVRAYIEAELRDYHRIKRELDSAEKDIIFATPKRDANSHIKSTKIPKPTETAAMKIQRDKRIKHMRRVIYAIEVVVEELPEEKKRLVELKYWQRGKRLTDTGVARMIPCGVASVYRWNYEILSNIAKELGM